jgi:hypothetical protein
LLIHLGVATSPRAAPMLWRLLVSRSPGADRTPRAVDVRDAQGQRVLAVADAGPLVDVVLPPGMYHVTTTSDRGRRRYTLVLVQDAAFNLRLSDR